MAVIFCILEVDLNKPGLFNKTNLTQNQNAVIWRNQLTAHLFNS